ncbi:MAG: hypothetical protein ACPLYF_02020, partial [Fervidobacterium sp.]
VEQNAIASEVYLNGSYVGSLTLALVQKDDTDVWAGKLVLNEKEYNIYILEGKRGFKAEEIREKIKEACEGDENCTQIARGIGNRFCEKITDISCREKIAEFCEQNPNDQRCLAVMKNYCANNTDDSRCRSMLKEVCKENPTDQRCWNYCQENPESCRLQIRTEVKERVRERLQQIKKRGR